MGSLAGTVPMPGLGGAEGFAGEGTQKETFFAYTDYLTPGKIFRLDVHHRPGDAVARA